MPARDHNDENPRPNHNPDLGCFRAPVTWPSLSSRLGHSELTVLWLLEQQ
jgi:hypothetical protein